MLKVKYVFPCGKAIEWEQKGDEKLPDDPVECPWHKMRCAKTRVAKSKTSRKGKKMKTQ